jgi:hypothetical protein
MTIFQKKSMGNVLSETEKAILEEEVECSSIKTSENSSENPE